MTWETGTELATCFECGYRFPNDYVSECSYCWEIICDECLGEHMTFHDVEEEQND